MLKCVNRFPLLFKSGSSNRHFTWPPRPVDVSPWIFVTETKVCTKNCSTLRTTLWRQNCGACPRRLTSWFEEHTASQGLGHPVIQFPDGENRYSSRNAEPPHVTVCPKQILLSTGLGRPRPDRPWGPPNSLYDGYRVSFQVTKRPGRGVNHPTPSSAEVKERVELYNYSPSGPSWPVLGRTLPLPLRFKEFTDVRIRFSCKMSVTQPASTAWKHRTAVTNIISWLLFYWPNTRYDSN